MNSIQILELWNKVKADYPYQACSIDADQAEHLKVLIVDFAEKYEELILKGILNDK